MSKETKTKKRSSVQSGNTHAVETKKHKRTAQEPLPAIEQSLNWRQISTPKEPPMLKRRKVNATQHDNLEWEEYRTRILELYRTHELPELMRIMAAEHGFEASEPHYKKKLKNWKAIKYDKFTDKQIMYMIRETQKRQDSGKGATAFVLKSNRKRLNSRNVQKQLTRKLKEGNMVDEISSLTSSMSSCNISTHTSSTKGVKIPCLLSIARGRYEVEEIQELEHILEKGTEPGSNDVTAKEKILDIETAQRSQKFPVTTSQNTPEYNLALERYARTLQKYLQEQPEIHQGFLLGKLTISEYPALLRYFPRSFTWCTVDELSKVWNHSAFDLVWKNPLIFLVSEDYTHSNSSEGLSVFVHDVMSLILRILCFARSLCRIDEGLEENCIWMRVWEGSSNAFGYGYTIECNICHYSKKYDAGSFWNQYVISYRRLYNDWPEYFYKFVEEFLHEHQIWEQSHDFRPDLSKEKEVGVYFKAKILVDKHLVPQLDADDPAIIGSKEFAEGSGNLDQGNTAEEDENPTYSRDPEDGQELVYGHGNISQEASPIGRNTSFNSVDSFHHSGIVEHGANPSLYEIFNHQEDLDLIGIFGDARTSDRDDSSPMPLQLDDLIDPILYIEEN